MRLRHQLLFRVAWSFAALGVLTACAAPAPKKPDPVFESCQAGRRAVEQGRVHDVYTNQRCGVGYFSFEAFGRTPDGQRCHIGYTCVPDQRVDPR